MITLGIDLGTTATKVVVFDAESGRVLAAPSLPSTTHSPSGGWAEADPAHWWANVCTLVPVALAAASVAPADVAAIATTSMVPAVVPVGSSGTALRRAILQNDARARREIDELAVALAGTDLVRATGSALTQQSVAPTWRWLRRHEADLSPAALVGGGEWLAVALGAAPFLERNWALESGLFTLDGAPLGAVLDAAALPAALLPPVVGSGTVVGAVSAVAAAATGLRAGTTIVAGGADHVLSAAAAGVGRAGTALVKLGGAGDLLVYSEHLVLDERLYLDAHPAAGAWLPNGCMATSGTLVRWVQGIVGSSDLATLDEAAAARRPAGLLCLPHFLGEKSPIHDPDLRGAFVGLHLGHQAADLHRAALEAVAYGFRWMAEVFAAVGLEPRQTFVANGGGTSPLWKQTVADVLDRPLVPVVDHAGAAYGAALAAAVGVDAVADWATAAGYARTGTPIEPTASRRAAYDDAYGAWRQTIDALTAISHRLARRANP